MSGLGAAALQLDPVLSTGMLLAVAKAFIGAAVGAYFGNHVSTLRARKKIEKQAARDNQTKP